MSEKRKPVIGETLYLVRQTHNGRRVHGAVTPEPVRVLKIGKKYFTTARMNGTYCIEEQFRLSDWRENTAFSSDARLFVSREDYADSIEAEKLWGEFRDLFNKWSRHLTIHQLRKIKEIIVS